MSYGYTGKILNINLIDEDVSIIDTRDYEEYGGGHGIGSAIFNDLLDDKAISGFDEKNVVTIMTSPLTGTMVPGGGSRTEVQGIGVQSYPVEWFTRSNFGGRFGPMLKYAGYDGIVIHEKADRPVWIDIRDGAVEIRNAYDKVGDSNKGIWGLDTWETQKQIWKDVLKDIDHANDNPAVLTIGPVGEIGSRLGSLVHDAGNSAGQGGFGGVFGRKNLKAISVYGTGGVEVADPKELFKSRLEAIDKYGFDRNQIITPDRYFRKGFDSYPMPYTAWLRPREARPKSCQGCYSGCRANYKGKIKKEGNESACEAARFYTGIGGVVQHPNTPFRATGLIQKMGINAYELTRGLYYLDQLHKKGVLGTGNQIDTDLDFRELGSFKFFEKFMSKLDSQDDVGKALRHGFVRLAEDKGRLEEDLKTGDLNYPYHGIPEHGYPKGETDWTYSSILGSRDANSHTFNWELMWDPTLAQIPFITRVVSAKRAVEIVSEKLIPFEEDKLMLNYSEENMYSFHTAKLVAWQNHYSNFYKQSLLFCDWLYPDFTNRKPKDKVGMTGQAEPRFFKAVTGKDLSFAEGMEIGRKIWNLDNAIWTLQGRHRDKHIKFAEFVHINRKTDTGLLRRMPGLTKRGKWKYIHLGNRVIDKDRFENFKTLYYDLEGWDIETGWPTKNTLDALGLYDIADEIDEKIRSKI